MEGNAKFYHKSGFPIVAVLNQNGISRGAESRNLPQSVVRKMREDYGSFIDDGVNIFIRRRPLVDEVAN